MIVKFIYVFSENDCEKLLELGYKLLKLDDKNSIYVFANDADLHFALGEDDYILSDVLTF